MPRATTQLRPLPLVAIGLVVAAGLLGASASAPLRADEVVLSRGAKLQGRVIEEGAEEVVFESYEHGPVKLPRAQIRSITRKKGKLDRYDARLPKVEDTADGHHALARWCKTNELLYRARRHWERAIELEPDHSAARKALGHREVDGAWVTEDDYYAARGYVKHRGKWVEESKLRAKQQAGAMALDITVAIRPDADDAFIAATETRIRQAAEAWWKCTEGQMYIRSAHIIDRTEKGDVIIWNLDSSRWAPGKEYGRCEGTTIKLGGKFPIVTFCHEWGHRWFGLPEEYVAPKCARCVMEPWKGVFEFCDGSNHTGAGEDCWTRIKRKFPKWRHPNPGFGPVPPIRITTENR